MSSRRCTQGLVQNPDMYYAVVVCKIDEAQWAAHRNAALKIAGAVLVDYSQGRNGDFNGGKWFYAGKAPACLV